MDGGARVGGGARAGSDLSHDPNVNPISPTSYVSLLDVLVARNLRNKDSVLSE